jgi:TonB-dependent siderophore receptor
MRPSSPALPAALVLAFAVPVLAQDPKPKPDEEPPRFQATVDVEEELPAIPPSSSTVTKLPVPVQELPVSVSVIPKRLLSDQDAFVLKDALENASGVNTAPGFGVFDYFVIRGFDSLTSGLVMTDGAPEPESTFYPTYNVRQVEVLKGPGAFVYGANALAGTVNLVRKTPTSSRFADVSLTYGRYDTFEGAIDANASRSDGKGAFRLNGVYQGTSQYRNLPYASLGAVNPTLAWRPDDKTHVNLGFEYVRSHQAPDTGIPFVGDTLAPVPRTTSYQSSLDDSVQNVYRVRLDADRRFGDALTLRNKFYYTELDWKSDGSLVSAVFPLPDQRLYVARALTLLDDQQKFCGDQLEAVLAFKTGSVHHDLLAGFEFTWLRDNFTQDVAFLPPIDLLQPVEPSPPSVVTIPALGQAGDSRGIVLAPYVLDRIAFSRKWQLLAGARLDTLNYDDPRNATSRDTTKVDPVGGLTFSPTSDLSLYVSGGTAFAPPSTQVVGPREPETGWQAEGGVKLGFLAGKGLATAAVYELQKNDIAIPDSSGRTSQIGDQRSRGIELELSAQPTKGWVAYATYAYTDAILTRFSELVSLGGPSFLYFDRSGNRAPFAPRHLATLWSSRQFPNGLGLAAGLRYVSSQFISEDNRHAIDGYLTLDAALSYKIGRVRAAVNFKNITSTEYETRGFGNLSVIPARPFEVLARLELGFGTRAR